MRELIVLSHRLDIAAAAQLARQATQAVVVTTCPHLADRATSEGLRVELLQLPGNDVLADAYQDARRRSLALQARIDGHLARFDPLAPDCGWGQLELFYAFYTLGGFARLWDGLLRQVQAQVWHVPMPDLPFRYGGHSYLPGLLLLERLVAGGQRLRAYRYELPPWDPLLLPDLDATAGDPDLLVHLPTCFYDHAHFEQAVLASGRSALHLPSQYYAVDLPSLPAAAHHDLAHAEQKLSDAQRARIDGVCAAIAAEVVQDLVPLLATAAYHQPQADSLVAGLRRQMVFAELLARRFDRRPPRALLLSNHDAGLHGPLLTLARRHRSRVCMVPHSKIYNAPVPSAAGLDLQCLAHPVQGVPVHDTQGMAVPAATLAYPEQLQWSFKPAQPLRVLGVLLTGVSYSALCGTDLDRFCRGLRRIVDWCAAHGVQCRIRCKPSEPLVGLLTAAVGLPQDQLLADMGGSLDDFAQACGLCLTYDQLTSGAVELLRLGVPTLHALVRPLLLEEQCMMDAAIVPRADLHEVLQRLGLFVADAQQLWTFGRNQFLAYARAWSDARPLQTFL